MDAMVRRVLAIAGLDPRTGRAPLDPVSFDANRTLCLDAQRRLEGLLRARGDFHRDASDGGRSDLSSAVLGAALDGMADEVAAMACTTPWMVKLADAERATGVLDGSAGVTNVLDAYASDPTSIEGLVAMLVSAMGAGTEDRTNPTSLLPAATFNHEPKA